MLDKNPQLWPEEKLLELMRLGDQTAFKQIYNRYSSSLYLSAYNLLRDKQACEDVVQEVFVKLWIRREELKIVTLSAFLHTAVRYNVFTIIRAGKVRRGLFDEVEGLIIHNETEETICEKDIHRFLDKNIAGLPEKCRQIFILSRREQLSTKEIAAKLGIAPKTVENQLTIAIRRLRMIMGSELLFWLLLWLS